MYAINHIDSTVKHMREIINIIQSKWLDFIPTRRTFKQASLQPLFGTERDKKDEIYPQSTTTPSSLYNLRLR